MKVRVGDLVRWEDAGAYYKVIRLEHSLHEPNRLRVWGKEKHGEVWMYEDELKEVVRPAKPRKTLTRKQAREWLEAQDRWSITRTALGWSAYTPIASTHAHPTFTAAVIALRKRLGVK